MRRLLGSTHELQLHIDYWFRQPLTKDRYGAVQAQELGRLGQYIWNLMGADCTWPELYYARLPEDAIAMAYAEFEKEA